MDIGQKLSLGEREKRQIIDIYDQSFPVSERRDFGILARKIDSKELLLFTASSDKQIYGFGIINALYCGSACLFEYLAIRHDKRALGIGSKILSHIKTTLSSYENVLGILLEVEPIEGAPLKEVGIRKKRIALYERFGATIMDTVPNYYMPDLSGSGYVPMMLMWLPLKRKASELSIKQIKEFITSIYTCSYGADKDNIQLRHILDGIR